MENLSQTLEYHTFDPGRLPGVLSPGRPPLFIALESAQKQLRRIANVLSTAGCGSVAVERHYIDRDYMEDHSVFYSRSLYPYVNFCTRAHFFDLSCGDLELELRRQLNLGIEKGGAEFKKACADFSREHYLGFSVIKPLSGSPVGRTVIRAPRSLETAPDDEIILSTRFYRVHLAGIELDVEGLAFQQQDIGVSACATTAIWSSLQIAREFEEIASATPAQITALASRYALPFGRAMPQEGLSIDQMCQAIQACGVSPALNRVGKQFELALSLVHSAVRSGLAPILIIANPNKNQYHAVTACGVLARSGGGRLVQAGSGLRFREKSEDLAEVVVHDDRHGPYLRAKLRSGTAGATEFSYPPDQLNGNGETWTLDYVLSPVHGKIRLSFGTLRVLALRIAEDCVETVGKECPGEDQMVELDMRISRPHKYIESFFGDHPDLESEAVRRLATELPFPRYVAVVRMTCSAFGQIDVLMDSTSTERNAHCLAVFAPQRARKTTLAVATRLAEKYQCKVLCSADTPTAAR
jgi:hypothetical protein